MYYYVYGFLTDTFEALKALLNSDKNGIRTQ